MKYNFYLDEKVTTWMRTNFEIEADSQEEADEKAKQFQKDGNCDELGWEEIPDTKERMTPEENEEYTTQELYNEKMEVIYANGKF
jgi:hypothetical protein